MCFVIHKEYGPDLFESISEEIICYELGKLGIPFKRQHGIPLIHEELKLEIGFEQIYYWQFSSRRVRIS